MEKKSLSLLVFIFLLIGLCHFVFGDTRNSDSDTEIMIKYKQQIEKYKNELAKLKPLEEELDREKAKGLSFKDKTLRVEKVVKYQVLASKIWQAMSPRCCGPTGRDILQLTEAEQNENKKFYSAIEKIRNIKKGITTRKEIVESFGEPQQITIVLNKEELRYSHRLTKIVDSYIKEPYGVDLNFDIIVDKNTGFVDDIYFIVIIWFG